MSRIPLPYPFDDRDNIKIVDLEMMEHLRFRNAKKERPVFLFPISRKNKAEFSSFEIREHEHPSFPTFQRSVTVKVSYNGNPATASKEGKAKIQANTRDAIRYQIGESRDEEAFSSSLDSIDEKTAISMFPSDAVFKLMLSPEDPEVLTKEYVRSVMKNLERKVGFPLKWIASFHYNTAHPHVHIIISRTSGAKNLSWDTPLELDKTLISQGIRNYAQDLATRILGRKSLDEWKKPFYQTIYNIGSARIDFIIAGNTRKGTNLFVPMGNGNAILSPARFSKLPEWQQKLILSRLEFLSKHSNAGFKKINGNWICTNPDGWRQVISDEGKLAQFKNIARTMGDGSITILHHNKPLKESVYGQVLASSLVDEDSIKVALVIKSEKDGKLYYVETTLSYQDYQTINGRKVNVKPREARSERYRVPEVHIEGKDEQKGGKKR